MLTVAMNPSNPDALAWYTYAYNGEGYYLEEAIELAKDLNQDLRLIGTDGSVIFYVYADGDYQVA